MKDFLAALATALAFAPSISKAQSTPVVLASDVVTIVKDNNAFAFDLYGELAKTDGNLFFSPYSISNALAMTYAGARGETAKQMATTLHLTLEQEQLHPAFAGLRQSIQRADSERKDKPKYQLLTANRLWGQMDYGFMPDFLKNTAETRAGLIQSM